MEEEQILEPFLIRLKERIDSDSKITPAGVSVAAGLSNAAIRQWFSGSTSSPTLASARKVCAVLNTTLEEFISEAQTPEEKEIVRLVMQLPEPLRRELLGYGRGLAAQVDRGNPEFPEDEGSIHDQK